MPVSLEEGILFDGFDNLWVADMDSSFLGFIKEDQSVPGLRL